MNFTMTTGEANPLPQMLTVPAFGSETTYFPKIATASGGSWLTVAGSCNYCAPPANYFVVVNAPKLDAGVYTGQIVVSGSSVNFTVQVILTIIDPPGSAIAPMAGGLSFVSGNSFVPAPQTLLIGNAGTGALTWTASISGVQNNAAWLSLSSSSGAAPSSVTVNVTAQNLAVGVYIAVIMFKSLSGGSMSVPVTLLVTDSKHLGYQQMAQLFFSMTSAGSNPLPQSVTFDSTGDSLQSAVYTSYTANGGKWLTFSGNCNYCDTPSSFRANVDGSKLQPGTYSGEITIANSSWSAIIPVTLVVSDGSTPLPGSVPGGLSFISGGVFTAGTQTVQIPIAGSGAVNWTATVDMFRGPASGSATWLSISNSTGTSPAAISVSVASQGLKAGNYFGEIVLHGGGVYESVPVTLVVSDLNNVTFQQAPQLNFTMMTGGANPLPQSLLIDSTGSPIQSFTFSTATTGGNWLSLADSCNYCNTATGLTVNVNGASLASGIYTGEVSALGANQVMFVPVTLTVIDPGTPLLGPLPGGLSFVAGSGFATGPQTVTVTNAGSGSLNWMAATITFRGTSTGPANWLTLSAASGTAPGSFTVTVSPQGLAAGNYAGEIVVNSSAGSQSIPVSLVITNAATPTFQQMSGLNFVMTAGGQDPLPQNLVVDSTGAAIQSFTIAVSTAGGGNWLSVADNCHYCNTPLGLSVAVAASQLPAGLYQGQLFLSGPSSTQTVPITLTIVEPGQPILGPLPGGLSFTAGGAFQTAPQTVTITNAGQGTLNWTANVNLFRGPLIGSANWLSLSNTSGSVTAGGAPGALQVNVSAQALASGNYSGEIVIQSDAGVESIPVWLSVPGTTYTAFQQLSEISFVMPAGGNALPQLLEFSSTGSAITSFLITPATGNGGGWLSVTSSCRLCNTPSGISVNVNASKLPAGIYTGQLTLLGNTIAATVPVILTVVDPANPLFGPIPGALNFVAAVNTPASPLTLQINDAGTAPLNWTASINTFRGNAAGNANWLSLSSTSGIAPTIVTASVSPQGLTAGTYLGEVLFQSSSGNASVPVTLVVSDSNNTFFQELPGLNFTMSLAGTNPPPQNATVSSTGSTALSFQNTTVAGNGFNWLTVSGCRICSTPAPFSVSVDGSKLAAGTYVGEAAFTGDAAAALPITLTVVGPSGPANLLSATPSSLTFNYKLGASAVPVQIVSVTSSGNSIAYSTTVKTGAPWLQVSAGGNTPGYVIVSVNTTNLAVGSYSDSLVISSQFSSSITIPVTLDVAQNSLLLSQPSLTFSYQSGGTAPAPQVVNISSAGGGLNYAAAVTAGAPWLSVSNGVGSTPGSVQISVDPTSLGNSIYQGSIDFSAPFTQTVRLPVTVSSVGTTLLSLGTSSLSFTGGGSQVVAIGTNGPAIAFTTSPSTNDGASWLAVSPSSGNTPASLTVTADATGLSPGNYSGTVIVSAPSAANSPKNVAVSLNVANAGAISASPPSLTFSILLGSTAQVTQPLQISANGQNQKFTIAPASDSWLAVTPTGGTTPTQLTVGLLNTGTLAPGVYNSKVTVQSPGNSDLVVPVSLSVLATGGNVFTVQSPSLKYTVPSSAGGPQSPSARIVVVQNQASQRISLQAQGKNGSKWLNVFPATSGVEPGGSAAFTVSVTPSLLPSLPTTGSANDAVEFSANGQVQDVALAVTTTDATQDYPALSSTGLQLYALTGSNTSSPDQKSFLLFNNGSTSFDWAVSADQNIVQVSPQFSVDQLAPGAYQTINVATTALASDKSRPGAANIGFRFAAGSISIPAYINRINEPRLPPDVSSSGIIIGPPGYQNPTVTLSSYATSDTTFSIPPSDIPSWLTIATTGKLPAAPGYTTLTFGLQGSPPDNQTYAVIHLEFKSYYNDTTLELPIGVRYLAPQPGAAVSEMLRPSAPGCTPHTLTAAIASPSQLFSSPAGLPVNIAAKILDDCGNPLDSSGAATVTFSTGEPALALTPLPDGTWQTTWQPLVAEPNLVTIQLTAAAPATNVSAQASVSGTITASSLVPSIVSVNDPAGQKPTTNTLAPGQILTIYGQNLASQTAPAPEGVPSSTVGEVQVLLGGAAIPIFFVSPGQINAVAPFTLLAAQSLQLVVVDNGTPSLPFSLTAVPAIPGIFSVNQSGSGQGSIVQAVTGQTADANNPVQAGDIVSIFGAGLGALNQPVDITMPAPSQAPLPYTTGQVSVIIGNTSAEVTYAGLAPEFFGLYQINARVPASAPKGNAVPVQISVNNIPSNQVTIAIH